MKPLRIPRLKSEDGVSALLITILLPLLFGFIAFGIDLGHLLVVRNELHKAADAGALAGAQFLLNEHGTAINEGCKQIAYDTAVANMSEKQAVEVELSGGDVQIGHWSFGRGALSRGFTPCTSSPPPFIDIFAYSFDELDEMPEFINAVRVVTWRGKEGMTGALKAASFFVRVFSPDFAGFTVRKVAVAYVGFAGPLNPGDVDQPIAICSESITDDEGRLTCLTGRMFSESVETSMWTDFSQPCEGAASEQEVGDLICEGGNIDKLTLGTMSATNGAVTPTFESLRTCWLAHSQDPNDSAISSRVPWDLVLPVVNCEGGPESCKKYVGTVKVQLLWVIAVQDKDIVPKNGKANSGFFLKKMSGVDGQTDWIAPNQSPATETDYQANWENFVNKYNLLDNNGNPATVWPTTGMSIYFLPSCTREDPTGGTGGDDFGIRAKYPVLVE